MTLKMLVWRQINIYDRTYLVVLGMMRRWRGVVLRVCRRMVNLVVWMSVMRMASGSVPLLLHVLGSGLLRVLVVCLFDTDFQQSLENDFQNSHSD
jgi:hypothetical protein